MKIVYGPVSSWRLKRSLGIDVICRMKVCPFDCSYCSLGKTTEKSIDRKNFVSTKDAIQELNYALEQVETDVITFSGTGEPTLAKNLGELIERVKKITNIPTAVLTNSSLMYLEEIRNDLAKADKVVGSLDAHNMKIFKKINNPHEELILEDIIKGMNKFSKNYDGKFSIEVMFTPENKKYSKEITEIIKSIHPEEVQINTPLRPSSAKYLSQKELEQVEKSFEDIETISVYSQKKVKTKNKVGKEKLEKLKRKKK